MPTYRKRPVVIEAEQFIEGEHTPDRVCRCAFAEANTPHIHTLEGTMTVSNGDYVIVGVRGEAYPCKPDIFEATYDRVI